MRDTSFDVSGAACCGAEVSGRFGCDSRWCASGGGGASFRGIASGQLASRGLRAIVLIGLHHRVLTHVHGHGGYKLFLLPHSVR